MRQADKKGNKSLCLISLYDIAGYNIRSLASYVREKGFRVYEVYFKDWINNGIRLPTKLEVDLFRKVLRSISPDIIGISIRASAYRGIARFLTDIARKETGAPVIWGGTHPTSLPEEAIGEADIICVGEGEDALVELMKSLTNGDLRKDIKNLWFREDGKVIKNPLRPLIQDLDSLPYPDYLHPDKFYIDFNRLRRIDPNLDTPEYETPTTRGCFNHCAYCFENVIYNLYKDFKKPTWRHRSVDHLMGELILARSIFKKMKTIYFADAVFWSEPEWIKEFCRDYKRYIGLPFSVVLQPQIVSDDLIAKLKEIGLIYIDIGIENTEDVIKNLYDRKGSDLKTLDITRIFHKYGVKANYHIIWDDPQCTSEDKEKLLDFLLQFPRPYHLYIFSLTYYPGTDITKRHIKEGLITKDKVEGNDTKTFYQRRVTMNFPRDREDIFYLSLVVLTSNDFIPRFLIRGLRNLSFLKKHPAPLVTFTKGANMLKQGVTFLEYLRAGKDGKTLIKRWFNLRDLVVS